MGPILRREGSTCLALPHRHTLPQRADHIIVLQDGRTIAQGGLRQLLEHCPELRALWVGER